MTRARILATVCAAALLLGACSQTVSGTPEQAGGPAASPSQTPFPKDIASLGKLLQGNQSVHTAHIGLNEDAAGTSVTATGVEKLDNAQVQAMDMSESVASQQIRFILIGSDVYAKLPAATPISHSKPWIEITASTSDPTLQQLYTQFENSRTAGAAYSTDVFGKAARDLKFKGTSQFDGEQVGHYTMSLDVNALPVDFPNLDQLKSTGLTMLPLQLWVDHEGRTRKFEESLTVMGQHVHVTYQLTKIDQPVQITAPPASQVEQK